MENSRFIDIHVLVLYSSNGIRFRHLTSAELIRSWVFRSIFWERGFGSAPPMPGVVMEYQSALQGASLPPGFFFWQEPNENPRVGFAPTYGGRFIIAMVPCRLSGQGIEPWTCRLRVSNRLVSLDDSKTYFALQHRNNPLFLLHLIIPRDVSVCQRVKV